MAGRAAPRSSVVPVFSVATVEDTATQRALEQGQDAVQDAQVQIRKLRADVAAIAVPDGTWINVTTAFGVVPDVPADQSAALQKAIASSPGRTLYLPKGKYAFVSSLLIADRSTHIVGDFGNRDTDNGTELVYYGTGPAIQIGVDNGLAWNAGLYNGPQDHLFENIHISHGAPDTALVSVDGTTPRYKAGAYGIWDWRGGGITTRNVGVEGFEANFVAIESDFDDLEFTVSLYSKYGVYIGPRSDQCEITLRNSFGCDRCITVDGARQVRILSGSFVGSGTSTSSPVEVRRGSGQVEIVNAWFEHLNPVGYSGTDGLSCVSAGEVDGYGSGGSIQSAGGSPNTNSAVGVSVLFPLCYVESTGNAYHVRYIISVGKCQHVLLDHPAAPQGISLSNFDAFIGVQASQSPSSADTQIEERGVSSSNTLAKLFTNLGGGSPAVHIWATGASGAKVISSSRFSIVDPAGAAGADELKISQEGAAGQVFFIAPQFTGGQTTRLRIQRSLQHQSLAGVAPASGTWAKGDIVLDTDASAGGFVGFYCTAAGTPGTWKSFGAITP